MYEPCDTQILWPTAELAGLIAAGALPQGRVLDLGCGNGTESIFLASMGWTVLGIDSSAGMIAAAHRQRSQLAKSLGARVKFKREDGLVFREGDGGTFAIVIERLVYSNWVPGLDHEGRAYPEHVYKQRRHRLIHTAAYALQTGGKLVMRTHCDGTRWGCVPREKSRFPEDSRVFARFFKSGREVAFAAVVAYPNIELKINVPKPLLLSVRVFTRNDVPAPRTPPIVRR